MKVIQIDECVALTDLDGITRRVRIDLLDSVSVGDYVMVHAGLAIAVVDENEARETLELIRGLADEVQ